MKIIRTEGELITYALGSCIGICFYDPSIQLGGLLHIMLPKAELDSPVSIYKYADTGLLRLYGSFRYLAGGGPGLRPGLLVVPVCFQGSSFRRWGI